MLQDALEGIIFLGLIGFLTNAIAFRLGFFTRPTFPRPRVSFIHLVTVFAIYFGFLLVLPFLLFRFLNGAVMTIQFLIILGMFASLLLYIYTEGRGTLTAAVKNPESPSSKWFDFGIGVLVWLVAFPWVGIVSQICDFLLEAFLNFKTYEQVAVRYLKDNLESAPELVLALLSIVVIAPIVEELLFRGTLQQFLKKYFSIKTSIAVTALIFACFHFSASQGLGNFSLIPSLFTFACFLGYTYERQGSIFASIGLHLTFNLASSFQIIFS
ncbi:MAG: CPBP family intramembrane metalloprotease [Rhabdochlamydiaceae bacterium]|jgi:membrane protease YdiL (CAAX protease family)|nr:CPBP family intramembrane metalloprotease [Rhabdochlamydiaceae bacterium]